MTFRRLQKYYFFVTIPNPSFHFIDETPVLLDKIFYLTIFNISNTSDVTEYHWGQTP